MEVIKFEQVSFSYEKGNAENEELFSARNSFALRGVDFSVREGEFVAILGHNGSGKSTLARLTNGLLTPTSGRVSTLGLDVSDEDNLFKIRRQVGIVFQNPDNQMVASIVEDDVAFGPENVGLPREEIGENITFALDAVGMSDFRHASPSRLSGGQKQRIAIAGVLALKPRVMILDESTAMLDPRGRKEVMDVVLKLNREEKITVILITHFPEEALLADRAIVMHEGLIVAQGSPKEIFSKGEELKKYSLVTPRPIRLCRTLSAHGLPVADGMDAEAVAERIYTALQIVDANSIRLTEGAGTRSNLLLSNDGEKGRIVSKNLSYVYNAKSPFATRALEKVDLEINSGDFFGIIGHTGSGKSTFVQHLNALLKVPSAEKKYKEKKKRKDISSEETVLLVNGYDLTDKKTDFQEVRSKVGMVFQYPEYQLFAETVFEDVAFGLKNFCPNATEIEIYNAVKDAIETVGLNFEEVKKRSPFELSGGQKRRVAVAGVIVTKPEILVLDEPAAGLDPIGKEEMMALLHKIHREWCKTVVIVSHDMDEIAENCTRAAIFSDGKVFALASPQELFSDTAGLLEVGLDIPFTAKIKRALGEKGVVINSNLREEDFTSKILAYAKMRGAGASLNNEGGRENA